MRGPNPAQVHILRNAVPIPHNGNQVLEPGEWLMNDDNAFQLALMAEKGTVGVRRWTGEDMPAVEVVRSILLIRSGAIGDLLMLSPCIKPLRDKYPDARITIACHKRHWPVMAGIEASLTDYPIHVSDLSSFALIISLENIVEIFTDKHAIDAFAEALGVTVADYRPVYRMTEAEKQAVIRNTGKRVALQLRASARIRDYHMEQWGEVITTLLQRGWEVMLIGKENPDIKWAPPELKDCSALSFREAAAVLATCDVFCGVDSAFFNLCPALGVPAIGLFGPVDWRTRVKEGMGQRALAGAGDCAPCGWTNSRAGHMFPPHGPCAKTGYCIPLAEIKPERVVAQIEKHARSHT